MHPLEITIGDAVFAVLRILKNMNYDVRFASSQQPLEITIGDAVFAALRICKELVVISC